MLRVSSLIIAILMMTACSDEDDSNALPRAVFVTSAGEFIVELRTDVAPITANNFIMHAEAGHFDEGQFYRIVRDDNAREDIEPMNIIQGGRTWDRMFEDEAYHIEHESTDVTGLSHAPGAISMARSEVGTASTEFFIMLNDYPKLDAGENGRNPDNEGYAVFGMVTDGMDIVETIWASDTGVPDGPEGFEQQWAVDPVVIETIRIE